MLDLDDGGGFPVTYLSNDPSEIVIDVHDEPPTFGWQVTADGHFRWHGTNAPNNAGLVSLFGEGNRLLTNGYLSVADAVGGAAVDSVSHEAPGSGFYAARFGWVDYSGSPTTRYGLTVLPDQDAGSFVGINSDPPTVPLDVSSDNATLPLPVARFGSAFGAADYALSVLPLAPNDAILMSGADFDGTNYIARATTATMFRQLGGASYFYGDVGLTSGNTFAPTARMSLAANGNLAAAGTNSIFGAGVSNVSFPYARVGDQGDANNVYLIGDGAMSDVGVVVQAKGVGIVRLVSRIAIGNAVGVGNTQTNVLAMSDIPAAIPGNPSSGGFLYVSGGSLRFRGPAGTVTVLALP